MTVKKRMLLMLPLMTLLLNCQGGSCSRPMRKFKVNPEDLIKFNPPDMRARLPQIEKQIIPSAPESQLPIDAHASGLLKTPNGYHRTRILQLDTGILYKQYDHSQKGPRPVLTIRAIRIEPRAFSKIQILFSDHYKHPLNFFKVAQRTKTLAIMNWGFFGSIPGGDIIGWRCTNQGLKCSSGLYHNSEKRTGKRTDRRYTLTINRRNQAQIFRGGLGPKSNQWYRLAFGGGILLFDKDMAPALWFATGRNSYNTYYLNQRYNELSIIQNGQAGDPRRLAPRSAMGIMADGSLIYMQLGEGKNRLEGGATPARLAVIMKELGAVRALMFDGGGAPVMVVRSKLGQVITRTQAEHTRTSNYNYNYSFMVLTH
jgi:hypothetical protein